MAGPHVKPVILIADDNPGHRKLLELVLSAYNFDVALAEDGHEALTYLQASTPDLMILDVEMPFMSGIDVCLRAKRVARLKSVPVIIMTARTDDQTEAAARDAKADLVVHKPVTGKNLRGIIGQLLAEAA